MKNMYLCRFIRFFSTIYKDIGTLYFLLGIFSSGLSLHYFISIQVRLLELESQLLSKNFALNDLIVTSHGIIMIFFAVTPLLVGGIGN